MEWTKEVDKSLILSEVSVAKIEFFIFIDYEIRIYKSLAEVENVKNEFSQDYCTVYWGKLQKKCFSEKVSEEGKNRIEIPKGKNVKT